MYLHYTIYTGGEDPAAADQQRPPGLHRPRRPPTHAGPCLRRSVSCQSQTLNLKILTLALLATETLPLDAISQSEARLGEDLTNQRPGLLSISQSEARLGEDLTNERRGRAGDQDQEAAPSPDSTQTSSSKAGAGQWLFTMY